MSGHDSHATRDVRFLLAAMGLNSLPLGYTLVVLPIYLSNIGFSGEVIGAITAASSLASTIALIPFAIAADRYGRKPFVFWGFLSATLAYLFFAFTRDLNSLLLAGAIGGIGLAGGFSTAVWTPAWTALISEKASPEKRTNAFVVARYLDDCVDHRICGQHSTHVLSCTAELSICSFVRISIPDLCRPCGYVWVGAHTGI